MVQHRRSFLATVGTATTLSVTGCLGGDGDGGGGGGGGNNLTFGASSSGSSTNAAVQGIQRALDEYSDELSVTAQETSGNSASMQLYDEGQLDLTVSGRHLRVAAENNEPPFEEEPIDVLAHQGFLMFDIHLWLLARADAGITHLDDIDSSTVVWPLPPGFSTHPGIIEILERTGLASEVEMRNMSDDDIAGVLEEGRVDVIGAYGAGGASLPGWLTQVQSRVELQAIEFSDEQKEQITGLREREYNEIEPYGFDQDLGLDATGMDALPTLTEQYTIDIGRHVPAEQGHELARVVHEGAEMIQETQPAFPDHHEDPSRMMAPFMEDHPVHPGVADYLDEQGVWDDSFERGEIVDERP